MGIFQLKIGHKSLGKANKTKAKHYRLFFADARLAGKGKKANYLLFIFSGAGKSGRRLY
jgi:hypothetical protein